MSTPTMMTTATRTATATRPPGDAWVAICELDRILPGTGVAAMVDGHQVAVFRLPDGRLFAVDHHDPCSGANVIARGIVGDVDGTPVVASPIHKQRFELSTGACLDDEAALGVHAVRLDDGVVEVALGA